MKDSIGDKLFYFINYAVLTILALSCLLPLVHVASLSLSDAHAVNSGKVALWPVGLNAEAYKLLIHGTNVLNALRNSLIILIVGTALNMLFTIMAAYPLSRKYFYARNALTLTIVFTMIFSGGLIPTYLLVKALGLVDTYWALWLPGLVSAFNLLILRTFFANIPEEMEEAARMDGCSEWRLISQIFIPLSLPALATLSLFYAVAHWNSFFSVLIYIDSTEKLTLTVLIQQMIRSESLLQNADIDQLDLLSQLTPEIVKAAGIMTMIAPMLLFYPFMQKFFVKGVMVGAIKG